MNTTVIVDLVSAVFLCVLLASILANRRQYNNKWELTYCLLSILMLLNDALAYTMVSPAYPAFLRYIVAFISMHGVCIIILVYTYYTESLLKEKMELNPWFYRVLKITEYLWFAASIYESLSRHMITFTDGILNIEYSFPAYIDIVELIFLFAVPVFAIVNWRKIGKEMAALFSIFAFGPIVATLLFSVAEIDVSYALGAYTFLLMDQLIHEQIVKATFEKEQESIRIIGALSKDYTGINYIEITDDENKDIGVSYRTSDLLKEMVPNAEDMGFTAKLRALRDNAVYEPDREQFYADTRRAVILEALSKADSYTVYPRLLVGGEIEYYELKFSAIREDGKVAAVVAGLRSIDEAKRNELKTKRQIEEALDAAESASRAKTEFLFNMSHDVRTPMNAIMGFTNIAEKHIDDKEKVLDCLQKTKHSGNLLLSLINGVLDMSRIESGNAETAENAGDVMLSFASIENTLQEEAEKKDITLSFEYGEITDRFVYADFTMCMRVFTNLITNSIKYTRDGGYIKVRCEQASAKENGYARYRYTIEDNGIGMSKEFQEHMFEAFTREYNSTTSGVQGTGLGLSVCKSFVDYLGGTIECESEQGRGTTFTVTLPFKVQEGAFYTDVLTGELVDSAAGQTKQAETADFSGRKVLLVEDNELNREIALDLLEEEELVVETAEDGSDAVEMVKKKGPDYYDFILMDIQMPVMNGYEATKAIREMYPDKHIPIIALSANAFEEDKAASMEAGMDDHVAKPINVKELFAALAKFM